MGIAEGEDKNKSKTKTMDQKQDKLPLQKEAATTPATTSPLLPAQSEVFDSSNDNAMSEMKEIADMSSDETSKVFSHVQEKQQIDPINNSVDNVTLKKDLHENNLNINPASSTESSLQERDDNGTESKKVDSVLVQDVKPDIHQNHNESKKQNQLGESVRFNDELNKEYHSTTLNNYDNNNNPFISGIKLWQVYSELWINAYNEYMKTWRSMFKRIH
jgi:hypothetical protein